MSDEKIYIYHTNDIHSDLTFWPRIAQGLQEKRTIREQNDDDVLFLILVMRQIECIL
jgi:hypothetical protein